MNVSTILDDLHRRGVRRCPNGDRLRWFANAGVVTEADLSALSKHKAEVLAILRERESQCCTATPSSPLSVARQVRVNPEMPPPPQAEEATLSAVDFPTEDPPRK